VKGTDISSKNFEVDYMFRLFSGDEKIEGILTEIYGVFAVSYPIICELFKGVSLSSNPEKGEKEIEKFLENVRILESGPRAAKIFGKFHERYPDQSDFVLMVTSVCIAEYA